LSGMGWQGRVTLGLWMGSKKMPSKSKPDFVGKEKLIFWLTV
jgi:hypothetical protein